MRLLAASFEDEALARAALARLEHDFARVHGHLRVAELGQAGKPDGPGGVLAGRLEDDSLDAIRLAVDGYGGTIIVDREAD